MNFTLKITGMGAAEILDLDTEIIYPQHPGNRAATITKPKLSLYKPAASTVNQQHDRHVVIPDLHGEAKTLDQVISTYYDYAGVGFVFLGDVVDKSNAEPGDKGVKDALDIIWQLQLYGRGILLQANHEWVLKASMLGEDEFTRRQTAAGMWLGTNLNSLAKPFIQYEAGTLQAYDIEIRDIDKTPKILKQKMDKLGHLAVLTSALPYYETDEWIATHAGLHSTQDLDEQKAEMIEANDRMARGDYSVDTLLPQWNSFDYALKEEISSKCTDKIVISGHAHVVGPVNLSGGLDIDRRKTNAGKRLRLATRLNKRSKKSNGSKQAEPLLVWEDWGGGKIRTFSKVD